MFVRHRGLLLNSKIRTSQYGAKWKLIAGSFSIYRITNHRHGRLKLLTRASGFVVVNRCAWCQVWQMAWAAGGTMAWTPRSFQVRWWRRARGWWRKDALFPAARWASSQPATMNCCRTKCHSWVSKARGVRCPSLKCYENYISCL